MLTPIKSALAICALALTPLAGTQAGDVDAQMNAMFGTMTSGNKPSVIMNSRRGVIDGGGFSVRSKISRPHLVSVDTPSLGAGCSGIDMYAGSLSFVSKEEFIQLGKNVMSNAAGYAFSLALGAACQDCRSVMDKMKESVEGMNKFTKNSCQLAQRAVDSSGVGQGMTDLGYTVGSALRRNSGSATDALGASTGKSGESVAQTAAKENPEAMRKLMPGNIVWKALKKADAASWWPDGSEKFNEAIMSVTGTVIGCVQGAGGGCASGGATPGIGEGGVQAYTRPSLLDLSDLIDGAAGTDLEVYTCKDSECLDPGTAKADFEGMRVIIHRVMFGDDNRSGLVPQMSIIANGTADPKADKFLQALGADGAYLRLVANQNPRGAMAFGHDIEDALVLEMSYRLAKEMISSAEVSVSNLRAPGAEEAMVLIRERKRELATQYAQLQAQYTRSYNAWQRAQIYLQTGKSRVVGPAPLGGPSRTD